MIYSWQKSNWNILRQIYTNNRLPHALLFYGTAGVGKLDFVRYFTAFLHCISRADNRPCGTCKQCVLIKASTHPDCLVVGPDERGGKIKVSQIRDFKDKVYATSRFSSLKTAVIDSADKMTVNAANALLKTLEEPPLNTYIFLTADTRENIPVTILSRCRKVFFPLPPADEALRWLQRQQLEINPDQALEIAGGAPLKAVTLNRDDLEFYAQVKEQIDTVKDGGQHPLIVAASWAELDHARILRWFQGICAQIIRHETEKENLKKRFKFYDLLTETRSLQLNTNVNIRLLLDRLLLEWHKLNLGR